MFAPEFEYHRVTTVAEAIQLLNTHPGAKVLAGGHSLIPLLKLRQARPPALIDIGGIGEMKGISVKDGTVRIGALTTHREIQASEELEEACPMLAEVAGGIGDSQVRNRGTIGGSVAHADPASDWPTVLTALNARFVVRGPGGFARRGTRRVAPEDFFAGPLTTALGENEILTAIEFPRFGPNQHGEYAKMAHPATSFAVVGAAAVVTLEEDRCINASVVVGGLLPAPMRALAVQRALVGHQLTLDSIRAAAEQVAFELGSNVTGDSVYASADYRRAMVAVEIRHALYHLAGLAHH